MNMKVVLCIQTFLCILLGGPLLLTTTKHRHVGLAHAAAHGGLRRANTEPEHCGCYDCTDSVWNLPVNGNDGQPFYTCGERISWIASNFGVTEEEACIVIAAQEFPAECGKACNPLRCDGNNAPYIIQDDPPIISGELMVDSDMYCFPSYNARQRWTNVWSNNFVMEVKEGACEPGANSFSRDAVSFDATAQELKLEFKRQNNQWIGGEVRLVLPQAEMPFHYGTYEWSVKSIKVIDTNTGMVVDGKLPPRLVLGLFTWDTTEDFAIRENRNHEVDIEISNFGDIGGPDVNFLVQPPGKPQQGKFYSGGGTSYDQSGHIWKFDWNPSGIVWYTSANGGMSHEYSSDIILEYASPPWLQCMPADVEIRMNLWSLNGVGDQLDLEYHEKIEVIIDSFTYTPSGETHVPDGGSCTKHCHCSPDSECDAGTCMPASTTTDPDPPISDPPEVSAACSAHPECAELANDCCPTSDGTFLYCCSNYPGNESPPLMPEDEATDQACAAHPACAHLAGMCCPTTGPDSKMLDCCSDNSSPPERACAAHPACAHLAGMCCPTTGSNSIMLDCCGN